LALGFLNAGGKCDGLHHVIGIRQPTHCQEFHPGKIADRHSKGLYFKCDQKFVPGHRDVCKCLFCIELLDDKEDNTEPTLSLAALTDIQPCTGRTMHVSVLIDNILI
jgi:hypothetical protein